MGSAYSCPECGQPQHGCCRGELCWGCSMKDAECRRVNGRSLSEQRNYELKLLLEKEKQKNG